MKRRSQKAVAAAVAGCGQWCLPPTLRPSQGPGTGWVQLFEAHHSNEQLCINSLREQLVGVPSQEIWVTCTGS